MTAPKPVWVALTGVWGDQAIPGLLLSWKRADDGTWLAWTICAEPGIGAGAPVGPSVTPASRSDASSSAPSPRSRASTSSVSAPTAAGPGRPMRVVASWKRG